MDAPECKHTRTSTHRQTHTHTLACQTGGAVRWWTVWVQPITQHMPFCFHCFFKWIVYKTKLHCDRCLEGNKWLPSDRALKGMCLPGDQPVICSHSSQAEGTVDFQGKLSDNTIFIFYLVQRSNPYRIRTYVAAVFSSAPLFKSNI